MGWETRERGGRYYTRSRKVGGRVVREYIGGGLAGELAAQEDQLARAERATVAAAWRAERGTLDTAETSLAAYCRESDRRVRDALAAAGYHQHARGEWRRRRHDNTSHSASD